VLSSPATLARTADGRFAPGHSGNPAGRPKGSRSHGAALIAALREGEHDAIYRIVIEAALGGDQVAARFCAGRIDAASRRLPPLIELPLGRGDELNPFVVHAKLVRAVADGVIPAEQALTTVRLLAEKRNLSQYSKQELSDEEWVELQQTDDAEDEEADEDDTVETDEDEPEADDAEPPGEEADPGAEAQAGDATSAAIDHHPKTMDEPASAQKDDAPPSEPDEAVAAPPRSSCAAEPPATLHPTAPDGARPEAARTQAAEPLAAGNAELAPQPPVRRVPRYVWVPAGAEL
jgi:hypothetical protein